MVKSLRVGGGGGLQDYTVSYLGQDIDIGRGRPRSLTIASMKFLPSQETTSYFMSVRLNINCNCEWSYLRLQVPGLKGNNQKK